MSKIELFLKAINPSLDINNKDNSNAIVYEDENFDERLKKEYGMGFKDLLEQLGE